LVRNIRYTQRLAGIDAKRVAITGGTAPCWYCRPAARDWACAPPTAAAAGFHAGLPGYLPTGLAEVPALADELTVGRVFVKDESARMGLAAFKVLGASWAVANVLAEAAAVTAPAGAPKDLTLAGLRRAAAARPVELVTATDGNHGRALAWMGRLVGLTTRVFVSATVPPGASSAIAAEGATVTIADGAYDRAVEQAAAYAAAGYSRVLVQDTARPGYERVPGWIVEGYDTLLGEIEAQLEEHGVPGPDLISVPVGVGSLAQAVVTHHRAGPRGRHVRPAVLAVEPDTAACLLASLQHGAPTPVPTAHTVMTGLNCGTISSLAWPVLAGGLDAAIAVPDRAAVQAMADLAQFGVPAGPSGAASLAGARAAITGAGARERRSQLSVTSSSVLVLISTEGRAAAGIPGPAQGGHDRGVGHGPMPTTAHPAEETFERRFYHGG
jgi:diaminopropionate ammonia-lyase